MASRSSQRGNLTLTIIGVGSILCLLVFALIYLYGTTGGSWLRERLDQEPDKVDTLYYFMRFVMEHDHRAYSLIDPSLHPQVDTYFVNSRPQACYAWNYSMAGGGGASGELDLEQECGRCVLWAHGMVVEEVDGTQHWLITQLSDLGFFCYPLQNSDNLRNGSPP